jgi:hypothetical protein
MHQISSASKFFGHNEGDVVSYICFLNKVGCGTHAFIKDLLSLNKLEGCHNMFHFYIIV